MTIRKAGIGLQSLHPLVHVKAKKIEKCLLNVSSYHSLSIELNYVLPVTRDFTSKLIALVRNGIVW